MKDGSRGTVQLIKCDSVLKHFVSNALPVTQLDLLMTDYHLKVDDCPYLLQNLVSREKRGGSNLLLIVEGDWVGRW